MNYRSLVRNDIRQIAKDPMLLSSLLGSLGVFAFARYAFPPLATWIEERYAFALSAHAGFAGFFLLTAIPLLSGVMAGLLMLDERDENLIVYFGVTPLTRRGYYRYRLFLPSLLTFAATGLFLLASDLVRLRAESGYALLLFALEAPCIALFLAANAANKVEGLALSKISGLLFAGPVIAFFVPEPWQLAGGIVPTYWPVKSYRMGEAHGWGCSAWTFAAGLAYHLLLIFIAARSFGRRMD